MIAGFARKFVSKLPRPVAALAHITSAVQQNKKKIASGTCLKTSSKPCDRAIDALCGDTEKEGGEKRFK